MEGANVAAPDSAHKDFPAWEQGVNRVHDQMLGYIRDAKTPEEARENLKKIFAVSTTTRTL